MVKVKIQIIVSVGDTVWSGPLSTQKCLLLAYKNTAAVHFIFCIHIFRSFLFHFSRSLSILNRGLIILVIDRLQIAFGIFIYFVSVAHFPCFQTSDNLE